MMVALPALWSMLQLFTWWRLPLNSVVLAVMLGVMLPRALKRAGAAKPYVLIAAVIAGSAAASGCNMLIGIANMPGILGAALFAAGVAAAVWVRKFGDVWKASGTLFSIPFMAVLVHPLPLTQSVGFFFWGMVAAAVALAWALMARTLENALPATCSSQSREQEQGKPQQDKDQQKKRGLASSSKMAIQLAVATLAAFVCAELIDAENIVWPVLTVLIVHSGNRGRGDILWKGAQRTVGALIGVTAASFLTVNLPSGDSILIVAIFVIIAIAAAVREFGYIFWAICITAALVFLYSFFGQAGDELTMRLTHRLLGIIIGSVIGILCGYFIFPVRTVDVTRLRIGALLAAAGDFAASAARGEMNPASLEKLDAANLELSHFDGVAGAAKYLGFGAARRLNGAVMAAHALANGLASGSEPLDPSGFASLAREIGAARRALSAGASAAMAATQSATDTAASAASDNTNPDPANPLVEYVRAIISADLKRK